MVRPPHLANQTRLLLIDDKIAKNHCNPNAEFLTYPFSDYRRQINAMKKDQAEILLVQSLRDRLQIYVNP